MTIALIAHDSKKELMVQFCTAYCRILSQHKLVATGTTGKMIAEATGLQVQRFLAGVQGGDQQIASRIACNEVDLLLFFRDPINAKPSEPNEMTLLRLCDGTLFQNREKCRGSIRSHCLQSKGQFQRSADPCKDYR